MTTELRISEIRTDGGTQPRAQLNLTTVDEYAESILDGATFPPVEVMYDGSEYWLWDGFHRVESHKKANCVTIRVNVKQGTRRDAVLASVGANNSHGLQRTRDDKRRAVMTLLNDAEWVKWSDREIARQCRVSAPLVATIRETICKNLQIEVDRTVQRNGTIYTQNTANIGKTVTPPVGGIKLQPKPADMVVRPRSFVDPVGQPGGEVKRGETRFVPAPPIRDDEEFDDMVDEAEEDAAGYDWAEDEKPTPTPSKPHVAHNSGNNEWYTPAEYIAAARQVMGRIDLDPATSEIANKVVQADEYFTADDNGLDQHWTGKVWMNPPYSDDLIGGFTEKLCSHFESGDVTEAIVLVNNGTETRWFQRMAQVASCICFPKTRVKFWRPQDEKTASPLQGQAILYFGTKKQSFASAFRSFGFVGVINGIQ